MSAVRVADRVSDLHGVGSFADLCGGVRLLSVPEEDRPASMYAGFLTTCGLIQ